jgi:hypothetical protein
MVRVWLIAAFWIVATGGIPTVASADVIGFGAELSTGACVNPPNCENSYIDDNQSFASIGSAALGGNTGAANASANAGVTSTYGTIDASVSVARVETDEYVDGVTQESAGASATGAFYDSITVHGTGMVEILPTFFVDDDSVDLCGYPFPTSTCYDTASGPTLYLYVNGTKETSGAAIYLSAGSTYQIEGLMGISLGSDTLLPYPNLSRQCLIYGFGKGTCQADEFSEVVVSGSADFYLDVLTPGASIQSGSGHDYATPVSSVPEPGFVWLTLPALAFVLLHSRKRHHRFIRFQPQRSGQIRSLDLETILKT